MLQTLDIRMVYFGYAEGEKLNYDDLLKGNFASDRRSILMFISIDEK
ncbi:hypothetical protein ACQPVP_07025 [Clostridium nigeriense]